MYFDYGGNLILKVKNKRLLSLVLSFAIMFGIAFQDVSVFAGELNTGNTETMSQTGDTAATGGENAENIESNLPIDNSIEGNTNTQEADLSLNSDEENSANTTQSNSGESAKIIQGIDSVRYIVIDEPALSIGMTQVIAIGIEEGVQTENAVLTVLKEGSNEILEFSVSVNIPGALAFNCDYSEFSQGVYRLFALNFNIGDKSYEINLTEGDYRFGVDTEVNNNPDDYLQKQEDMPQGDVVVTDENGNVVNETSIEDAIENANIGGVKKRAANGDLIITLDPGHCSAHGGASANGESEANITLRTAQWLKHELEQYNGVKVYMTRHTAACPFGGSLANCLEQRAVYAANVGSDLFVSLHFNSTGKGNARGAEVWYPNRNARPDLSDIGAAAAQNILNELVALGLKNRGIKVRTASNGSDYYAVIRHCKNRGIAGIIVEHAFMDNVADFTTFINDDNKLHNLAIADAIGIAKTYNLTKGSQIKDYEPVFNAIYYWNNYSDLQKIFAKPAKENDSNAVALLNHFIQYGMRERRQATPGFNVNYYYRRYEDLRAVFRNDWVSYYRHYIQSGYKEGRDAATPIAEVSTPVTALNGVDYSKVYDLKYYLANNPDIQNAFGGDEFATLEHFVNYGMKEGRQAIANFDVRSYYFAHPDLRRVFGNDFRSYYYHYMNYGYKEGRIATGVTRMQGANTVYNGINYAAVYNFNEYLDRYGDLRAIFSLDENGAMAHFINHGMSEGRMGNNSFDIRSYYNQYVDLRNAYATDFRPYFIHYINFGRNEGRITSGVTVRNGNVSTLDGVDYSKVYDYDIYRNNYADLRDVFGTDEWGLLRHFVNFGMSEGRTGDNAFYVNSYYNQYPDLRRVYGSNLKAYYYHYMNYGHKEGRKAPYGAAYVEDTTPVSPSGYAIMGTSATTVAKMVSVLGSRNGAFNSALYQMSLEQFCQNYYNICQMEGIRAEVAFGQMCLETGYLKYGGDVQPHQYNFAGIGATGGGNPGNSFATTDQGMIAHVQHLKLYAGYVYPNGYYYHPLLDPRHFPGIAGKAKDVQSLQGTWAMSTTYANSLMKVINNLIR